jgi:Holliday junction DNA helicase RuvA
MIASLAGVVEAIYPDSLVLEVGGIGYRVYVAPAVLATCEPGGRLKVHTYHVVREDAHALYGFRTVEELGFFSLLLTVTGVGPKVALAIVGSRPVPELQLAILAEDQGALTAIPGVGKRLAGRIVLELREKVAAAGSAAGAVAGPSAAGSAAAAQGEVTAALQALGYTPSEAREAARAVVAAGPPVGSLEDRVKAALRELSRG